MELKSRKTLNKSKSFVDEWRHIIVGRSVVHDSLFHLNNVGWSVFLFFAIWSHIIFAIAFHIIRLDRQNGNVDRSKRQINRRCAFKVSEPQIIAWINLKWLEWANDSLNYVSLAYMLYEELLNGFSSVLDCSHCLFFLLLLFAIIIIILSFSRSVWSICVTSISTRPFIIRVFFSRCLSFRNSIAFGLLFMILTTFVVWFQSTK